MNNQPKKFYIDFSEFIRAFTEELDSRELSSKYWTTAVSSVLGLDTVRAIGSIGLINPILELSEFITNKISARLIAQKKDLIDKIIKDYIQEERTIKYITFLESLEWEYMELQSIRKIDKELANSEIDELFYEYINKFPD